MALTQATQEAVWLNRLKREINCDCKSIHIFCDNQSALSIAENGTLNARTKHIDIRCRFIKEQLELKTIEISYVSTSEQAADVLTKSLGPLKQNIQRELIGIVNSTDD